VLLIPLFVIGILILWGLNVEREPEIETIEEIQVLRTQEHPVNLSVEPELLSEEDHKTEENVDIFESTEIISDEDRYWLEDYYTLSPTTETIDEMEIAWMETPNARAVLILIHACKHKPIDWFTLPEDIIVVTNAISEGFHLVAFDSTVTPGDCFKTTTPITKNILELEEENIDLFKFKQVSDFFLVRQGWDSLPLVSIGFSKGSEFASLLPVYCDTFGTYRGVIEIVEILNSHIQKGLQMNAMSYLPIAFVQMPKDERRLGKIKSAIKTLTERDIPNAMWEVWPAPVRNETFHEKLKLPMKKSVEIFQTLLNTGVIDPETYLIIDDPRTSDWFDRLKTNPNIAQLVTDRWAHFNEVLRAMHAFHECTSTHSDEALHWITQFLFD